MSEKRTSREIETRVVDARVEPWTPPSVLPDPTPQPGWRFRWIRTSSLGHSDNTNVSQRFRDGWEPCRAEEFENDPNLVGIVMDHNSEWAKKGAIEMGGLLLCKAPEEKMAQRDEYYRQAAENQMSAIDQQLMSQSDARMPILKPERTTTTTFGRGVA